MWGLPVNVGDHLLLWVLSTLMWADRPLMKGDHPVLWENSQLMWEGRQLLLGGPPGVVEKQPVDVGVQHKHVDGGQPIDVRGTIRCCGKTAS